MSRKYGLLVALLLIVLSARLTLAQNNAPTPFDMGNPTLTTLYVATSGDDNNDGAAPERALRTITAAWERIPRDADLTDTGYHIAILPGVYSAEEAPNFWEARHGTAAYPIIIEALNGPNTVYLPSVNIYDAHYLYFLNINIEVEGDAFHCERCDHLLVRGSRFAGAEPETYNTQETVKVNQSQYVYFEQNDISGAWDNAVDFVAVQYGHFLGNHIHNAGDWCMYLKGGSAYFLVSGNEFDDCGAGGFTAGQGTGFQYMTPPWIQYEAYDIKFVNNLIHDAAGAGVGVQGGYNILIAYNTLYRVGERSHVLEFGFGSRSCDGQPGEDGRERCDQYAASGGWGNSAITDGTNYVRIPNRNVYVFYNLIDNPAGYRSAYQHLTVYAPYNGPEQNGSNVPAPARTDENLILQGNLIWNGDSSMPLGVEAEAGFEAGCQNDNPTCNLVQLRDNNAINTIEPALVDPANGNYALRETGMFSSHDIPDFSWDVPVPPGNLSNAVAIDFSGASRDFVSAPGAFVGDSGLILVGDAQIVTEEPATVQMTEATPAPVQQTGAAGEALPPGPITLVTLGDSLTEGAEDEREQGGYPGRLMQMIEALRPGSTLLNIGHSGWNSDALINGDQGLPGQLDQAVEAITAGGRPALALVWIGSNDLFYLYEYNDPDPDAEQADLDTYARNLDAILSRLTGAGARVALALLDDQSLRPVVQRGEAFPGTSREEIAMMSQQARRYNEVIMQKAAQYGALTVDFFNTTIFTDEATLADDGNHPSADGYDVIASSWFAALQPLLAR